MPTGELLGPPISGAIYDATNNWHCVIAFSGTIQVAGAIVLLYGALTSLRFTRLRLTNAQRPIQRDSRESPQCSRFTRTRKSYLDLVRFVTAASYVQPKKQTRIRWVTTRTEVTLCTQVGTNGRQLLREPSASRVGSVLPRIYYLKTTHLES